MHLKGNIHRISGLLEDLPDNVVQLLNKTPALLATAFLSPQYPLEQVDAILHPMIHIFLMSNHDLGVIFTFLQSNSKTTVTNADPKNRIIRFFLNQTVAHRIFMFLLMFLQIAHIKIFLVTSFYLACVFFPPVPILQVDLHVLFQVGCCCEGFAASLADEGFLLSVHPFVSVQV